MLLCTPLSFRASSCIPELQAPFTWNCQTWIASPEEHFSAGYGKWASSSAPSPTAPSSWTMWFAQHTSTSSMTCSAAQSSGVCLAPAPGGQSLATLGRLHGNRLQLQVPADAFPMLETKPTLAAHGSQAALPCF